MGMGIDDLVYLAEKGHIRKGTCRMMDIGSQNLYNADVDKIRGFVQRFGKIRNEAEFVKEAERLSYFSTPRPGERTSYISELLDMTDIFYTSYDVCPALKTEIFDLNRESIPTSYRNSFDIVLNFGTTEHVFNQMNSFKVMHECMAVGGVAFHQLPSVGWINHAYFNYHWVFFEDLLRANNYELLDTWYMPAGVSGFDLEKTDFRDPRSPLVPRSADYKTIAAGVFNYNLNCVFRKVEDKPFSVGLELATSHSSLSTKIETEYGGAKGGLAVSEESAPPSEAAAPLPPSLPTAYPRISRVEDVKAVDLARELTKRVRRKLGLGT